MMLKRALVLCAASLAPAVAQAQGTYTIDDPYRWMPTVGQLDEHLIRAVGVMAEIDTVFMDCPWYRWRGICSALAVRWVIVGSGG